ncbi:hypothetical protein SAMN05192543_108264 [Paraburkholderia megapolitana]|uniref:Uncharacterized protein n=1 Tax=Paraburkholderia megapolitana TaxID=420953 RepID=A0A1I3SKT6_9BURK|nr:hypothetical protein SAMN05192543_108264 [Paraburkholderia megapolitana]
MSRATGSPALSSEFADRGRSFEWMSIVHWQAGFNVPTFRPASATRYFAYFFAATLAALNEPPSG